MRVIASPPLLGYRSDRRKRDSRNRRGLFHPSRMGLPVITDLEREQNAEIEAGVKKMLRRFDDANIWSGCYKDVLAKSYPSEIVDAHTVPRLVVTVRLRYWSLPFSWSVGGHLICRRGFMVGVGPIYFSWSWA